jgi:hypothetical protein
MHTHDLSDWTHTHVFDTGNRRAEKSARLALQLDGTAGPGCAVKPVARRTHAVRPARRVPRGKTDGAGLPRRSHWRCHAAIDLPILVWQQSTHFRAESQ